MSRSASVAIIQQMEKSDKQTDVGHPENRVNPLQTLKSQQILLAGDGRVLAKGQSTALPVSREAFATGSGKKGA